MYQVEIKHDRDFSFTAKAGESEFVIDAKGKGLTPLDAFLAGLGSCTGVYIRKYAEGSKLDLSNFKVKVSAELSKEAPFSFRQIFVAIDLAACRLDERRQKALLEFIKNCPVHNTIKGSPQVEFKISC
ncbi:OsmC family peroxiredoxin [bacterium]|nr:MAG: OsmC family peroxiredoxin [bacterium]